MGRYYYGQISGKFWFGVQSSDDASHFGLEHNDTFKYYVCQCEIQHTENASSHIEPFCKDCFSSLDEHKQAMIDEGTEFDDDTDTNKMWFKSDCEISYTFESKHIDMVESHIKILEESVGKYMSGYKIVDTNDEITYEYEIPKPADLSEELYTPDDCTQSPFPNYISNDDITLIARLCLGKQILYCLHKHGMCELYAEC
jgi:hypothetical protein